jgi:nickel transport system ATP-binding protein
MSGAMKKDFRRDIQLVFQDAISAANPRKTVREISLNRCAICSP